MQYSVTARCSWGEPRQMLHLGFPQDRTGSPRLHSLTNSTVRRELSASVCQLPLNSLRNLLELTYIHTHLRSFTQSRFHLWNPLLLCCCLGSVANFFSSLIRSPNFRILLEPLEVQNTNHGSPDFHGKAWIFAFC
jgi:hypothetical protein